MGDKGQREISLDELKKHNTKNDAWMAIKGVVYDVTDYAKEHPGGYGAISKGFGMDATKMFNDAHNYVDAGKILGNKKVGVLKK